MKEKINIFIIMHKDVNLEKLQLPKIYKRLLVGKKSDGKIEFDDTVGNSISSKNKYFCELTGLYWLWKNVDIEYIGLCHYRRFFIKNNNILKEKDILSILNKKDIILPVKWTSKKTVYKIYEERHVISDLKLIREIICDKYNLYLNDFDYVMEGHNVYTLNMFIANKSYINSYCEWLFDILFEFEKKVSLDNRDEYQKRVYGFLAERLFNVWIHHNNLKIYESDVWNTEETKYIKIKRKINRMITKIYLKSRGEYNEI